MAEENGIWIISSGDDKPEIKNKSKGMFDDEQSIIEEEERAIVSAKTLQENLCVFLANIDETLVQIDTQESKSDFKIEEIELSVGVNSKGKIGLWGIGAEAGGNASIKLKLKRKMND